jgi:Zn-dependent protease
MVYGIKETLYIHFEGKAGLCIVAAYFSHYFMKLVDTSMGAFAYSAGKKVAKERFVEDVAERCIQHLMHGCSQSFYS